MRRAVTILLAGLLLWAVLAAGPATNSAGTLTVQLGPVACESGVAKVRSMKLESRGAVDGQRITFAGLLPETGYDLRLVLADGRVCEGVDMSWYNAEPAKSDAEELTDDDREQIRSIVSDVRQFYDRSDIVLLAGSHDRATALVQQIRDSAFHSDKGGEVIWRVELWYFKNQHGGWERIGQQNKVLARERFASRKDYDAATGQLTWVPELGGIRIKKGEPALTVTLPLVAGTTPPTPATPTTAPTAAAALGGRPRR